MDLAGQYRQRYDSKHDLSFFQDLCYHDSALHCGGVDKVVFCRQAVRMLYQRTLPTSIFTRLKYPRFAP